MAVTRASHAYQPNTLTATLCAGTSRSVTRGLLGFGIESSVYLEGILNVTFLLPSLVPRSITGAVIAIGAEALSDTGAVIAIPVFFVLLPKI